MTASAHHEALPRAEYSHISEDVRMLMGNMTRHTASHGESCNRAVLRIGNGAVFSVDERHALTNDNFRSVSHRKDIRFELTVCVAGIGDHDHLPALTTSDQVIQNIVELSLPEPAGFVLAAAMLNIEYRITLIRIVRITGRRIHPTGTVTPINLRFVLLHGDCTVGNILQEIIILFARNINEIYGMTVSVADWKVWMYERDPVRLKVYVMKSRRYILCLGAKVSVLALCKLDCFILLGDSGRNL